MRHLFKTRLSILLLFAFMMLSLATFAQQQHFIYIQADDKQPFSINLNGKYYSSSSIGYIILPKLTDGRYTLEVNFAKNSNPEQIFTVNVDGKDYGYALKNFGDKGWGLFNYQTTDMVMSNSASPQDTSNPGATVTNNSAFGNMLADVINDKSINTLSTADTATLANAKIAGTVDETNRTNETATADVPDTIAAALDTVTNTITQNDNAAKATDTLNEMAKEDTLTSSDTAEFSTSGVIKAEENVGDNGTDLTFIDFNGVHNDTIKAFIPAEGKKLPEKIDTVDVSATAAVVDSVKGKIDNPFFSKKAKEDKAAAAQSFESDSTGEKDSDSTTPTNTALVNTTCSNMVSDGDLNKLKKRIVSETDQDAILQTVKRSLRNKCITTIQVRDLGNLFLNDDNRFGFYDAVYPFVYDYGNYASLESTLIDPDYKTRFKALLH